MNAHVRETEVLELLRGTLRRERVVPVARHVERCRACVERALANEPLARSTSALVHQLIDVTEHPDLETTLTQYAEGTLDATATNDVETHLATCARCREDVDDLRGVVALLRDRRPRWWPAALAAAAVLLIAFLGFQRLRGPSTTVVVAPPPVDLPATVSANPPQPPAPALPAPRTYARAEWTAAVNAAIRAGSVAMPAALTELQLRPDAQRAPSSSSSARLEPNAAIVDEARPRFRWTPAREATYVVSIFDGSELVAESPRISRAEWQPARDLPRGKVYQWQVEVRSGETTTILPTPPAPPALFRVLDRASHDELANARELHAGDPLLLGVLYANHGLRTEAAHELAKVDSDAGRALLRSLNRWRS